MVTQNELRMFYETDLKPKLLFLEEQRLLLTGKQKTIWIIRNILVVLAILAIIIPFQLERGYFETIYNEFGISFLHSFWEDIEAFIFYSVITYMIIFSVAISLSYTKKKSTYRNSFKTTIVGSLVKFIDKNLNYDPKNDSTPKELLFKKEFYNSDLFRNHAYRFSGEDYVGGIVGGTSLNVSEIHAERREVYDSYDGSTYNRYYDIFKGLFFVFNVNRDFEGVTTIIVHDDYDEYYLKKYLSFAKKESTFKVYSDNPTIAKYVFSTAFMERLLALHNQLKAPIELSFVNGKLYIAISIYKDLFEPPPISSTVLDFQLIQAIFEYMNLGKKIVEELIVLMEQPNQMDLK
ncbi:DUF3137 domain-containing protein [Candidatus Halobeggiatoa sp. HSG11]|nr:DUF3137 domain-containing protein [Candidatus Halobeggiatoa sp. HSG11]